MATGPRRTLLANVVRTGALSASPAIRPQAAAYGPNYDPEGNRGVPEPAVE